MEFCPEITKIILIKRSPNRQILLFMDIKRNRSAKSAVITLPYLFIQAHREELFTYRQKGDGKPSLCT